MTTTIIDPRHTRASSGSHVAAREGVTSSTVTPARRSPIPPSIPQDQVFFWTLAWQEGELESAAEREAGNVVTFDDTPSFMHWLFDAED